MILTQINPDIGVTLPDIDCVAVALLSESAQQQISKLLRAITERLGDAIWPMPANALHITLCEIIQPKPYIEDKSELMKNLPQYEHALEGLLRIAPVEVSFNTIEVSPQAIIIRGEDDGTFNRVRSQLVPLLPLPAETKLPPDIIHSSIARYRKEVDINEVRSAVADLAIDFNETIHEFQLIKESAPHLVNYSIARRYLLT